MFIKGLAADKFTYYIKLFSDSFYLSVFGSTIVLSLKTTLLCLILGYPTAYFLARTQSKYKSILMIAVIFPFLISAVVRSYGWMVLLGDNGIVNQFLLKLGLIKKSLKIMYTETAVMIGMAQLLVPYMILSIMSVIQSIDENVEHAAYSLGANPLRTFFKVILPLSSPGVLAGCTLVFTLSMTSYITPQLLGGAQYLTVSTFIFNQVKTNYNIAFANAICYVLVFVILLFQVFFSYANKRVSDMFGGIEDD
jgi:putative spermidine/putrescine transport system permease protein